MTRKINRLHEHGPAIPMLEYHVPRRKLTFLVVSHEHSMSVFNYLPPFFLYSFLLSLYYFPPNFSSFVLIFAKLILSLSLFLWQEQIFLSPAHYNPRHPIFAVSCSSTVNICWISLTTNSVRHFILIKRLQSGTCGYSLQQLNSSTAALLNSFSPFSQFISFSSRILFPDQKTAMFKCGACGTVIPLKIVWLKACDPGDRRSPFVICFWWYGRSSASSFILLQFSLNMLLASSRRSLTTKAGGLH